MGFTHITQVNLNYLKVHWLHMLTTSTKYLPSISRFVFENTTGYDIKVKLTNKTQPSHFLKDSLRLLQCFDQCV